MRKKRPPLMTEALSKSEAVAELERRKEENRNRVRKHRAKRIQDSEKHNP